MYDDLAAYFVENVVAAYQEYRSARRARTIGRSKDLRLAMGAAIALYHLREHMPASWGKGWADVVGLCPDYALLSEVTAAAKHKMVDRKRRKRPPSMAAADAVFEELAVTEYTDASGPYWHWTKTVVVQLANGTRRDLYEVLTNVMNMWVQEFDRLGVGPPIDLFPGDDTVIPPRSDATGDPPLDVVIVQGVRFRLNVRLMRHNYATGVAEPIDLAGHTLGMRLWKPTYTLDVVVRNETSGEVRTESIHLTDTESARLHELATDGDRQKFLETLVGGRGVMQRLLSDGG
jgi:hypothetical protein